MGNVIYSNVVGSTLPKSYVLETEDGITMVGVLVGEETVMTATPNDIRKGKIAATSDGIVEGQKDIPAYRTSTGRIVIVPGKEFSIPLRGYDQDDYTKIQCIIAPYNTTIADSVASDMIVLNDSIFPVGSSEKISEITKNFDNKSIDFNITNNSDINYFIYFFTYRQED